MASEAKSYADLLRRSDIQSSIEKCYTILACGVFQTKNVSNGMFEAAVVLLLINLSDLLAKAHIDGCRVDFTDHVKVTGTIKDVTDLIRECRNAACHTGSGEHKFHDVGKFKFVLVLGEDPSAMSTNGNVLGCDFKDDAAIFYGSKRVYLRRHLHNALVEVTKIYPAQ